MSRRMLRFCPEAKGSAHNTKRAWQAPARVMTEFRVTFSSTEIFYLAARFVFFFGTLGFAGLVRKRVCARCVFKYSLHPLRLPVNAAFRADVGAAQASTLRLPSLYPYHLGQNGNLISEESVPFSTCFWPLPKSFQLNKDAAGSRADSDCPHSSGGGARGILSKLTSSLQQIETEGGNHQSAFLEETGPD